MKIPKSKLFSRALVGVGLGQFNEALEILSAMDMGEGEPNAKALKARILKLIELNISQNHTVNNPSFITGFRAQSVKHEPLPSGRPLPRISVITPSFNQGKFIAETIQSVIDQRYPNVEHILIDGGSTDETMTVVERFRASLAYVVCEKDRGQSHALNKGFSRATGEILCWLNSDDQLAPGALYAVALAFDSGDPDMVAGICEIYQDGQLKGRHLTSCRDGVLPLEDLLDLDNGWNSGQFFYQPEVFFSRNLWERAGSKVCEDYYYSMDYDLWCRFALANARIKVIGSPLARFRTHPAQKTASEVGFKAELRSARQRFIDEHQLTLPSRLVKPIDWSRRLRVAMINDHGGRYGAGIAHLRIGVAFEIAECQVELFELRRFVKREECDTERLLDEINAFNPDVVIFGNVHSVGPSALNAVIALCERYQTAWVSHDFWIVTGRCAYFGECNKYQSSCDSSCPTANEYPMLPAEAIGAAHAAKLKLLRSPYRPAIWANSAWALRTLENADSVTAGAAGSTPSVIRLGVPQGIFYRKQQVEARWDLNLGLTDFVVLFSASSLSDKRKGIDTLIDALHLIESKRLVLLVLGNADIDINSNQHTVVSLGYVTDQHILASAFAAADVFVGPSKEETFGQVFIEAALSGTPSIAFDCSGMIDSVEHGTSGLRVAQDPESLALCIERLADDVSLRESISFWAPIWARSTHSLEASYRTLHHGLEDMGVLARLELPKRITLMGQSHLCPELVRPFGF